MKLSNPCSIKSILEYAETVPFDAINDNQYINAIYNELTNLNTIIDKKVISAVFQMAMHYVGKDTYIDVGCAILSFATMAKSKHDMVHIDLLNDGAIGTSLEKTEDLELEKIQELCNNLKIIIAEVFSPKVPD